jgi:hypothetical protein
MKTTQNPLLWLGVLFPVKIKLCEEGMDFISLLLLVEAEIRKICTSGSAPKLYC